jgi:putative ubiquitin-RnfH superfamily antitoxin RatB of RatAB toxin-antitoxin module
MQIGVAYAEPDQQVWLKLEVPQGSTLLDALNRSGILSRFPQVDLKRQKVGIFGKFAKLDTPLRNGDRVEIYRPITVDPTKVKRRKLNTT